jgi:hypothetical protein
MTLYALAKKAGIANPQHLYNLFKSGSIKAERVTCEGQFEEGCGHTAIIVSDEEANRYLEKRAERQAKKQAEIDAEVQALRAEMEVQIRAAIAAEGGNAQATVVEQSA